MNIYRLLSLRNDLKAVLKCRLPQRIVRRVLYKHAFRATSCVTRLFGVER